MSEYELNLLRQRGLAARDSKAGHGAVRFTLPPGLVWSEDGRIELDPDERVQEVLRLVFAKFRELGSARQVFLWIRDAALQLPVVRRNGLVRRIEWRGPAYHSVVQVLHNPLYAGAYAFGRKGERTRIVDGHAMKTTGHTKPMTEWNVLIRDHHEGYIDSERFEENQRMLLENAHMKPELRRRPGECRIPTCPTPASGRRAVLRPARPDGYTARSRSSGSLWPPADAAAGRAGAGTPGRLRLTRAPED
jgi:hypothetical protein